MEEMTALDYFREKARMTKADSNGFCDIDCMVCPLSSIQNGTGESCMKLELNNTRRAIAIVQKWAVAHPRETIFQEWATEQPGKTLLQDFLEKYPEAPMTSGGYPALCPCHLGYEKHGCGVVFDTKCKECWNRPLEEVWKL